MRFPRLRAGLGLSLNLAVGASACSSPSEATLPQGAGAHLLEIASGLSFPLYLTASPNEMGSNLGTR